MKTLKTGIVALTLLTTITLGQASVSSPLKLSAKAQDIECLAKNIYHEARGEGLYGQIAVAQVTVNRVASGQFQSSICKAVYASKQFSWTIGGAKRIKDTKAWQDAVVVAQAVLTQSIRLPDFKALYFHTKQVKPKWAKTKRIVAVINNHIFYS